MSASDFVFRMRDLQVRGMRKLRRMLGLPAKYGPYKIYEAAPEDSAELAKSVEGDLARVFFSHRGRVVHK